MNDNGPRISIHRYQVLIAMMIINVTLAVLHWLGIWVLFDGEVQRLRLPDSPGLFNMDAEASIPTWWAQALLLLGAILAFLIGTGLQKQDDRSYRYWLALGGIFLFMSIDEAIVLHETLTDSLRSAFGITGGLLFQAWIIAGVIALGAFGFVFFRFWWNLAKPVRLWMAAAGIIFVTGAVAFEMLAGMRLTETDTGPVGYDSMYAVLTGFEELLELSGATLFIFSLLTMLRLTPTINGARITVTDGAE